MRIEELPSPGLLSQGVRIRTEACKAINALQISAARRPSKKSPHAAKLRDFFQACADAADGLVEDEG